MLVKDWMTENVITLDENESIVKAMQILKEHKIRRIPITSEGKLVGIITDKDIKDATPSKLTSFDVHEFYYLLSELKLKDIMTKDPITVYPEDTIEYAAVLMLENKISGLPVINKDRFVVGIITQTDIFKLFVNMSGVYYSPYHLSLLIDHSNQLLEVFEIFKNLKISIYSLLTWKDEELMASVDNKNINMRKVFIRFEEPDEETLKDLLNILNQKFKVIYFMKDDISRLPKRKTVEEEEEVTFL